MEAGIYNLTIKGKFFKTYGTVEFTDCDKIVKGTVKLGKEGKKVYDVNGKVDSNKLEFYGSYVMFKPHFITVSCKGADLTETSFAGDVEINGKKKRITAVKAVAQAAAPVSENK